MKRKGKGFTIVELVIVIAVIAILAAVLVPTFSEIIRKAQTNSDIQLVSRLNELLSVDEDINGAKRPTMHDAVVVLEGEGYKVENLTPTNKAENNIVYDLDAGRFQLLGKDNKIILTDEKTLESSKAIKVDGTFDPNYAYRLFKMYDSLADFEKDVVVEGEEYKGIKFSIYASPKWTEENVSTIKVGFDAGRATTVKSVSYIGAEAPQDVVIRTNDIDTTLKINDASTGSINHYGEAGLLEIIQCYTNSYHENGSVAFADIQKGRIVLEKDADVKQINIKKTGDSFDNVIIADGGVAEDKMPEIITRDSVVVPEDMTEGMLVATVQKLDASGNVVGTPEEVKAYPNGSENAGSTQKVVAESKNVEVVSTLGVKILDNGAGSDKALTEEKKVASIDAVTVAFGNDIFENIEDPNKGNYVARIGTTGYTTLDAAVADAQNKSVVIVLLKDIDYSSSRPANYLTNGGNYGLFFLIDDDILNLNGHTLTSNNFSVGFDGDNATIKNGKFKVTDGGSYSLFYGDASFGRIVENVTFEDLECKGGINVYVANVKIKNVFSEGSSTGTNYYSVWCDEAGQVEIYNGTYYSTSTIGGNVLDLNDDEECYLKIYGGTFTAPEGIQMFPSGKKNLSIYGGTFNRDPSVYVAEGYKAVDNGNGTWTVVKK